MQRNDDGEAAGKREKPDILQPLNENQDLTSRLELGNLRLNFTCATQKSKVDGRSVRQVLTCVQRAERSEHLGSVEWNLAYCCPSNEQPICRMEWLLNLRGILLFER